MNNLIIVQWGLAQITHRYFPQRFYLLKQVVFYGLLNCQHINIYLLELKMHQINLKTEEIASLKRIKHARQIIILDSSLAPVSTTTTNMPPQLYHSGRQGVPQPFTMRAKMGNVQPRPDSHILPSCSQTNQLKAINVKRICQAAGELKRGLLIYRYLQNNEEKCKQIMFSWFQDLEAAFLNSLNGPPNQMAAQTLLQEELKARSGFMHVPCQENKPVCFSYSSKSILEAVPCTETDLLRQQVENYRRDSIESLRKINEIIKVMGKFKAKYEAEKKERKALFETVMEYAEEGDRIIEKITSKLKKDFKVSLVEQEVRQVLTKLKFKAYAKSAI